jgi:hypothetical protein
VRACLAGTTTPAGADRDAGRSEYPSTGWMMSEALRIELHLPPEKAAEIFETVRGLKYAQDAAWVGAAPTELIDRVLAELDAAQGDSPACEGWVERAFPHRRSGWKSVKPSQMHGGSEPTSGRSSSSTGMKASQVLSRIASCFCTSPGLTNTDTENGRPS